jgi:NTP pyrophosphatase (non-canonical NTP hydrolase)
MADFGFSTELTLAETERLALLLEEMGEAQQIIGKILRHGYASKNPFYPDGETNRELLTRELGDVLVAIDFLTENGDVKMDDLEDRKRVKNHRIWDWLHYQT